jgi:hypothetical protein
VFDERLNHRLAAGGQNLMDRRFRAEHDDPEGATLKWLCFTYPLMP